MKVRTGIIIVMLLLLGGIGIGAWLLLPSILDSGGDAVQTTDTEDGTGTRTPERNWNMTQQDAPSYDISEQAENEMSDESLVEPKYGIRDNAIDVTVPPDPQDAEELTGTVRYDDIPSASQIEGGYTANDIKDALVHYIQIHYPSSIVSDAKLIGNGTEHSQTRNENASWASYVISFNNGMTKGFTVTCSPSTFPYVNEANYLSVSPTLLYKVDEDEYVQIDITEEEPIP